MMQNHLEISSKTQFWTHMGPYGAHMGPPGQVRTWPNQDFWSNLTRFGSRNGILTKWHNDSASFLLEKLKNQVILTKNPNIWPKIPKIPEKSRKFLGIPRDLCGDLCGDLWFDKLYSKQIILNWNLLIVKQKVSMSHHMLGFLDSSTANKLKFWLLDKFGMLWD